MSWRVLVVDDNPRIQMLISDCLTMSGDYEVTCANNGEEAIEVLSEDPSIDLVILDLQMPITDGWETLKIIKDPENGFPNIAIIMLTVEREAENALKSWTLGADFFVSKPFSTTVLMETVNKALSKERTEK